jgi:hypothetical protein
VKYTQLLYSRSSTKDYRWMLIPEKISPDELRRLSDVYDVFDRHKNASRLIHAEIPPLFLLKFENLYTLICCQKTPAIDEYGRTIYAMQGICVPLEQATQLRNCLPHILQENIDLLNVWASFSAKDGDKLAFTFSAENDFHLPTESAQHKRNSKKQTPALDEMIITTFDKDGLDNIISFFLAPGSPLVEFLFGATPEMPTMFPSAKIVAPFYKKPD